MSKSKESYKIGDYVRVEDAEGLTYFTGGEIGVVVGLPFKVKGIMCNDAHSVMFQRHEGSVLLAPSRLRRVLPHRAFFKRGDDVVSIKKGCVGARATVINEPVGTHVTVQWHSSDLLETCPYRNFRILPRHEKEVPKTEPTRREEMNYKLENAGNLMFSNSSILTCGVGLTVEMRVDSWLSKYVLCQTANYGVTFLNIDKLRLINMEVDEDVSVVVRNPKQLSQQEFDQLLKKLPKATREEGSRC